MIGAVHCGGLERETSCFRAFGDQTGQCKAGHAGTILSDLDQDEIQFVLDRGGRVVLGSLEAPPSEFDSVAAVFAAALAQEQDVSAAINNLYAAATEDRDFASVPLLDWFVTEQIEEEATFTQILDDLKLAGDSAQTILFLDRELGERGIVTQ